jgi:hypothetical protein
MTDVISNKKIYFLFGIIYFIDSYSIYVFVLIYQNINILIIYYWEYHFDKIIKIDFNMFCTNNILIYL